MRLNRLEQKNTVNDEMYGLIRTALPSITTSSKVRCVVLTGSGRYFSAGGDIKFMVDRGFRHHETDDVREDLRAKELARLSIVHDSVLALARLPQPLVVGLNGATAGAGLSLALLGDYRVATERAVINSAFAAIGLPGDTGISCLLRETVGKHQAKLLLMRPRRISASEALSLGLVDEVAADDEFEARLSEVADEFADLSPLVVRTIKRDLLLFADLAPMLDTELLSTLDCQESAEHERAIQNVLERISSAKAGEGTR